MRIEPLGDSCCQLVCAFGISFSPNSKDLMLFFVAKIQRKIHISKFSGEKLKIWINNSTFASAKVDDKKGF